MSPVVKWAGGKRQILDKLKENLPENFNNYFEPFIGGGALLFDLAPEHATINDVNQELLAIYTCLKDDALYKLMLEELDKHEANHSEDYYYEVREWDRNPRFELEPLWKRAARAIYLNKACFNGLYRVNAKGFFNVPSAKKEKVNTYSKENMEEIHEYFRNDNVTILSGDFVEATRNAKEGDLVYFDPPYDTWEDKESFTAYSKFDFNKDDQRRLAECFKDLTRRGVKCMLSNHNTAFINELYDGFNIKVINAKRMINANASGRGAVEEVIITNY
ncbi:MAG: DNA adenine methylase [Acholeplasmatales bacterium]|nr:DNA adenine methylase [Acholeplasmatales bacterium]